MDHGENTEVVVCVAVSNRDHRGAIVAAMSVSAPDIRADLNLQKKAAAVLTRGATSLSTRLGHSDSAVS